MTSEKTNLGSLHVAQHNLSVEHVGQFGHHLTLDGQLLIEQGQVILQLSVRCDENTLSFRVVLRSASTTQHLRQSNQMLKQYSDCLCESGMCGHTTVFLTDLKNIQCSQLCPSAFLWAVDLCAFDYDGVGW